MKDLKYIFLFSFIILAKCNPPDYPSPVINKIFPVQGSPGSSIEIEGDFLYLAQSLFLDTFNIHDFSYDPESKNIKAFIPDSIIPGTYQLYAIFDTYRSQGISFKVTVASPVIKSISPLSGNVNDTIKVFGNSFENKSLEVHIGNVAISEFLKVSSKEISFKLSESIKSGILTVVNVNGKSNGIYFNVNNDPLSLAPTIDSVDSNFGVAGETIRMFGNHFEVEKMSVTFPPGIQLSENDGFKIISTSSMSILIPDGATSGLIKLKNEYGESGLQFEVIMPPRINKILPGSNKKGGPLFIYGENLKRVTGIIFGNSTTIKDFNYHLTNENEEIISLIVPSVPSGNLNVKVKLNEQIQSNSIAYTVISGSMQLPSYLPTLIIPNAPPPASLKGINNQWIMMGNSSRYGLNLEFVNDSYWIINDFSNNLGVVDVQKNSFVLNEYYGKFDISYGNEDIRIYRIILTPISQGNQIEMIFPFYLESISPTSIVRGDSVLVKGRYFLDEDWSINIGDGIIIEKDSARIISDNLVKFKIPDTTSVGQYKIRVIANYNPSNSKLLKVSSK